LIKFFRSSFLIQYFVLAIFTAAIWIPGFLANQGLPVEPNTITPVYNIAHYLLSMIDIASPGVAVAMVFISALTLNNILVYHELIPKNNILPAFVFIILMGSNPVSLCTYPVLLSLPLFTWFLHTIYKMNDDPENYMEVFNASILVSLTSMIYPLAVLLFPFIWIALLVYGIVNGRNIIISIIAFLLPYVYLALYFFWVDKLDTAVSAYTDYFSRILHFELNRSALQLAVWGIFAIFMVSPAFLRITGTLSSFSISFRKKMAATTWLLAFSIPMIIFSGKVDYHTFIFLPASVMVAHYYNLFKKSLLNEIILLVFIFLVLVNNYMGFLHA
jgi:hypothetical protein